MKALLISQYYPPEVGSAAQKVSELAEYLADNGHQVTVVTGFPNHPAGVVYNGYRRKLYQREKVNGVRVMRTFLLTTAKRRSFRGRMKNHVSFMFSSIFGALGSGRHDLVYVYSPPLFLGFSAYVVSRLFRVPFVLDLNDLWPKAPIFLGILKNPTLIRTAEKFERFVYAKADYMFLYSSNMRREIVSQGVPEAKTEVHPLWVDTEFYKPVPADQAAQIRETYNMGDRMVVMYTGSMGPAQGLDTVINTAEVMQRAGNNGVQFVFVGDGAERASLIQMASSYNLDNVQFVPPQPVNMMPAFMSASDVLVTHLDKAPFRLGTIPGKLLNYMSCARPVLAGLEGESADLVAQHQCGIVVEPQNPEAMARGLMELSDPEVRRRMGEAGRAAAVAQFERTIILKDLERRMREIAAHGRSRSAPAQSE